MRILMAVGCNAYDQQKTLWGAEGDAQRIFDALIRPELGDYDAKRSKLLLSPTIAEVRDGLRQVFFSNGAIDTFTFFFAGHGGVGSGSFYMLVRDSVSDALSFSALSLSNVFLAVTEAAPSQTNIIIDACEAGGLISDLNVLLKSDVLGNAHTPGITLVATSAQNEPSGETLAGGLGTNAILDCIEGRDFVQDSSSALDLVEVGRRVSTRLRSTTSQSPVVWGLNLYGPPRFCRNLRYDSDPGRPLREVIQVWPSASDASIRSHYDALWQLYGSVGDNWNPRAFSQVVGAIVQSLIEQPVALIAFLERLATTVLERAHLSEDLFRPAQVGAALTVSLLPYLDVQPIARQARQLQVMTGTALISACTCLVGDLEGDRYALLTSRDGGLSDLFYLPMRVSNILGWAGVASTLFDDNHVSQAEADRLFAKLVACLLDKYTGSITVMSDAQAPCWAIAFYRAIKLGLTDLAERLAGLIFSSLLSCKGNLARSDIPEDEVFNYVIARQQNKFDSVLDITERPDETTTVVLRVASILKLEEEFDTALWELDGHSFLAYLNDDFAQFGTEMMKGGRNVLWTIGHGIFRVSDLAANWPTIPRPGAQTVAASAMLSALLYPDRIPWFVFEELAAP
jgi:hypothetical protein